MFMDNLSAGRKPLIRFGPHGGGARESASRCHFCRYPMAASLLVRRRIRQATRWARQRREEVIVTLLPPAGEPAVNHFVKKLSYF